MGVNEITTVHCSIFICCTNNYWHWNSLLACGSHLQQTRIPTLNLSRQKLSYIGHKLQSQGGYVQRLRKPYNLFETCAHLSLILRFHPSHNRLPVVLTCSVASVTLTFLLGLGLVLGPTWFSLPPSGNAACFLFVP